MDVYAPDRIRNVALIGHIGSGKTTLIEALLFRAGVIARPGRIEDGNTVSDFSDEEQSHRMSINLAVAPIEWNGYKINLVDTPGMADFEGDVLAAMSAVDLAVFVVSAADGVEPNTEYYWMVAEEMNLPRMIFINKLDRDNADFERTLAELRDKLGSGVAPIELPIGEGPTFHGVADLFRDKAYIYDSGSATAVDMPAEMAEHEHEVHDQLVEGIVVADDDLLTAYLDGAIPAVPVLEETMKRGVVAATVFPVVCGSATVPIGVDRLADFIVEVGPSPVDRPVTLTAGDLEVAVTADPAGEPLVTVFKTAFDRYIGAISLFRVVSGTIKRDDHLFNHRSGADERFHTLFGVRGKEQLDVLSIGAGDIGAIAKLGDTETGDTLSKRSQPVGLPRRRVAVPTLATALVPATKSDETKMADALHRLHAEDPTLIIEQNPITHQTLLHGLGEMHLAIALERMASKFGVTVSEETVRVPYRETITRATDAEGKHKKQSGGHGQYGVCTVRFEPLPEGSGFEFVDATKGGSIPKQYLPAVEKGIRQALTAGGKHGFPVTDLRATCLEGKYHSVDSSELAFAMAGRAAFHEALSSAEPVILEPLSEVSVYAPSEFQGDIMGDITSRRGRVLGTNSGTNGNQIVTALVPTSEVLRYAIDLRSMTGGRGRHTMRQANYQELPASVASRLVDA